MAKNRILLVDDSPNELRILMEVLKDKYAIVAATSGFQALQMIKDDQDIELVLLDVVMPDMDGYETCQKILEIAPHIPIMFVSGNTHTEEILRGFDVGGLDYLTKPIDATLVARKVKVVIEDRARIAELSDENKSTTDMVMSVIASAGHLGTVLGFLRSGLKIRTPEALVSALFDVFDGLNIDACVQLRMEKRVINRSSQMMITPLEQDLLYRAANMQGRFLEKGSRYIVNFESVSVIIKNMPDDEMERGELRDNLMMIIEDTDALNKKMGTSSGEIMESPLPDTRLATLREELQDIQSTMEMIIQMQTTHKQKSMHILEDMQNELGDSFFKLGLIETQENTISELVNTKAAKIISHIDEGMHVEDNLTTLRDRLVMLTIDLDN
ncbi:MULTISPECIES: response regulator [Alteromonadaceae]|uniref:Response regulator n=1 Tax=Brumicola blandensis TaxID=3075611 RepID=A0AAW8R6F7_9ALTE|nr:MULTISPECIES: response regulator [unclassified Alteromonas]MDT0584054.1 response regulator [Alteromonas sp. W409]MDT0628967.1 response regulator [Alteromonas sp. W364]